jgi:hypothetical protein
VRCDIDLQQAVDHFRHLGGRERRADDLADRGLVALGAAERHLVPLAAVLVHAQDADVAHVVVAAGVDAAGDVQFDVADVVLEVDVLERSAMAWAIGIDLALASEQKSPPGQQMMSVSRPMLGVARPCDLAAFHSATVRTA